MIFEKKTYQTSYGLLRILACCLVIIHHFDAIVSDASNQKVIALIDNLTMINNGLFFMLSGKFALEHFQGSILSYYYNRFVKIILPYLIINCILNFTQGYTFGEYILRLRSGEIYNWFVYAVAGFYLVAPFLHFMFHDMSEKYKLLFLLGLLIYTAMNFVEGSFGNVFYIASNQFFGTISFFFLGYLVDNVKILKKHKWSLIGAGIISACVSSYEAAFMPEFNPNLYGLCLTRICMCISVYVLVCWYEPAREYSEKYQKCVKYMAGLTYYVYLFHVVIQDRFAVWHSYRICKNPYVRLGIGSLEVAVLAFVFAFIYRTAEKTVVVCIHFIGEKIFNT